MKMILIVALGVCLSLSLVSGAGAYPHGWHGGWHGGFYGGWYGPWYPYAYPYNYYYYPYAYPYYYPQAYPSASVPVPNEPQQSYWYFCRDSKAYYPYVTSCPGGWVPVVPTPPQSGKEGVAR